MPIFFVIFLCLVLSSAARAETIFFCESTDFVVIKDGAENYRNQKFKIKVTSEKVKFSGDSYFGSTEMEFRHYVNDKSWIAGGKFGTTALHEGTTFSHAYVGYGNLSVVAIKGECSKF